MGDYSPEQVARWLQTVGNSGIIPHPVLVKLQSVVQAKMIDGRVFSDLVNRHVLVTTADVEDLTMLQCSRIRKAWHQDFPAMVNFTLPPEPEIPAVTAPTAPPSYVTEPSSRGSDVTQLQSLANGAPNSWIPPTSPRPNLPPGYPGYGPPVTYPNQGGAGYPAYPPQMGYYAQGPPMFPPAPQPPPGQGSDWNVTYSVIERLVNFAHLDRSSAYMAIQDLLPPEVWSDLLNRHGSPLGPSPGVQQQPEARFDAAASSSSIAMPSEGNMSLRHAAGLALLQGALCPPAEKEDVVPESARQSAVDERPKDPEDERPIHPAEERPINPSNEESMSFDFSDGPKHKPPAALANRLGKAPGTKPTPPKIASKAAPSQEPTMGSDGHVFRSAAEVAALLRSMPESQVPEKQREETAAKVEQDGIDGASFTKIVESHKLDELGLGGRQGIQVTKFWKNVLQEDAMRKAAEQNFHNAPAQKAVKMVC